MIVFVGLAAAANLYFGIEGSNLNMVLGVICAVIFIAMLFGSAGSDARRY